MKKIITETPRPIKIWTDDVEETALKQLRNVAALPIIHNRVKQWPTCIWQRFYHWNRYRY